MDWSIILGTAARALVDTQTAAFALAAIGIGVHFGYTGLLNFGQAGFLAIGAYGFALPYFLLPEEVPPVARMWIGVGCAILGAVLFAFILGVPTLRLRADYLAIVTIASAEIVRYIFSTSTLTSVTGGTNGLRSDFSQPFFALNPFPEGRYGFGPFESNENTFWARLVGWTLVVLAAGLVFLVMRSPYGRVLKGIREDEDAVRSLGKNVYAYKMQALVLGGVMGSLGGIVMVLLTTVVPSAFGTQQTFFIFTALLLGGAATVFGPAVGAILFWVILTGSDTLLRQMTRPEAPIIPDWLLSENDAGQVRFVIVGVVLMLLVIFRPQGIFGNKKELSFSA